MNQVNDGRDASDYDIHMWKRRVVEGQWDVRGALECHIVMSEDRIACTAKRPRDVFATVFQQLRRVGVALKHHRSNAYIINSYPSSSVLITVCIERIVYWLCTDCLVSTALYRHTLPPILY